MSKNVPYYMFDEDGNSDCITSDGQAYIDDNDLKELLIDLLGEDISDNDIQKILEAASDENITEEEFDKLVDDFILLNRK